MISDLNNSLQTALKVISWNITLRCPLKCPHCYSDSGKQDAPDILSLYEARDVLDQIREVGRPVVILSGGEPLMHEGILDIARYGTDIGLKMALGTSGVLIDEKVLTDLIDSGISGIAISLDSADPDIHDKIRGLKGAWNKAVQAIKFSIAKYMNVQINMTIFSPEKSVIDGVVAFGKSLGVRNYQIFIPVPTGRCRQEHYAIFSEYEKLVKEVLVSYPGNDLSLRPTCFPQFRRIADEAGINNPTWGRGCIAGISYCRIYANGDVTPCPYLPVIAGNLRNIRLKDLWTSSEVFTALRDPGLLKGKCGICPYNQVCGGCRARAFSVTTAVQHSCGVLVRPHDITGELCGEDPLCTYNPGKSE